MVGKDMETSMQDLKLTLEHLHPLLAHLLSTAQESVGTSGQKLDALPKKLLRDAGFVVKDVPEGHLCCGWAGTYQVLQPDLSRRLPPAEDEDDAARMAADAGLATARVTFEKGLLQFLRDQLTGCIGCGCLSLKRCRLANPDDRLGEQGDGPQRWE